MAKIDTRFRFPRPCTDQELLAVHLIREGYIIDYDEAGRLCGITYKDIREAELRLDECKRQVRDFVIERTVAYRRRFEPNETESEAGAHGEKIADALEDWCWRHNFYLFRPAGGDMLHVTVLTLSNSTIRLWYRGNYHWTAA